MTERTTDSDDFADYAGERVQSPAEKARQVAQPGEDIDELAPDVGEEPDFEPPD